MIHSARQTRPTSTLRRTASSTPSFSTTPIDFSKQFGFHSLIASPLPSPALPSIVPRHGKKRTTPRFIKALRILIRVFFWTCAVLVLYRLGNLRLSAPEAPNGMTYLSVDEKKYDIDQADAFSRSVKPAVVVEAKEKPKWTISIPPNADLPLRPSQYAGLCIQSDNVARQPQSRTTHSHHHSGVDRTGARFVDVQEARSQGLLMEEKSFGKQEESTGAEGHHLSNGQESTVCTRSLTFVMESEDAGLGKTLMGLWMAYGLAQDEGRAFFIDDSNWAYGKYSTFFKPPSEPPCRAPPLMERLPCPHQTRHLVVSTSTYRWVFGHGSDNTNSDTDSVDHLRAFSLARVGHKALFHLADADAQYLSTRLAEIDSVTRSKGGLTIGIHVRRGDRHPWEFQYSDSYIPLSTYKSTAQSIVESALNPTNETLSPPAAARLAASYPILASDDPDTYSAPEFLSAHRAQSRILLASKSAVDAAVPSSPTNEDPAFTKFVEPNIGWEGGFFASIFWGLGNAAEGRAAARGLRQERPAKPPSEETLRLRGYVARAYLLDLAVLGRQEWVVCGGSSIGCRLLGVMKGLERWVNVDGGVSGWVGLEDGE